jgi:hypothetical protein
MLGKVPSMAGNITAIRGKQQLKRLAEDLIIDGCNGQWGREDASIRTAHRTIAKGQIEDYYVVIKRHGKEIASVNLADLLDMAAETGAEMPDSEPH